MNTQLLSVPWLSVRAIDLRSSHPKIEQRDFFELRPEGEFRVVVCSMVLNCVPDARDRGEMLRGIRAHLSEGGVAFIMVPLRCVQARARAPLQTFRHYAGLGSIPPYRFPADAGITCHACSTVHFCDVKT